MTNQTNGTVNGHGKFPQPVQQYSTVWTWTQNSENSIIKNQRNGAILS
jgi:hypothetical protein